MAQIKRETAIVCMVDTLLQGSFVKTEGWTPSYFSTELGNISRVNIVGVIVSKEPSGGMLLDDGSGRLLLRSFDDAPFEKFEIGDLILIIGRPRIYNEQKYVLPEIIKKIDSKWGAYRRVQLDILKTHLPLVKKETRIALEPATKIINYSQKALEFIRDLDDGTGAEINEVTKRTGAPNAEDIIRKLIEEGEIYEIKPGKVKVLE
jgi:RPA family protein